MAEIGIVIEINVNSFPELVRKMQSKELELFRTQWFADYPDAENFLALFYKGDIRPGIYTNFVHDEYNKLYDEALACENNITRSSLYKKMNELIASELPIIPQTHATALILYYDNIKNLEFLDAKLNFFEYIDKI